MAKAPPVPTAVGGATGEVSAMAVEKAGGGPVLQFAAALAGAVVGGAGATGLGRAATKAIAAAESAFLSGESAAAGRAAATAGAEAGAGVGAGAGAGSAGAGRAAASGELAAGETAAARAATSAEGSTLAESSDTIAAMRKQNIAPPVISEKLSEKLAELPQGGEFPHNPYNTGKGTVTLETGATISEAETQAAQAFADRGYHAKRLAEVGSQGVKGVGTPDLHIDGFGRVEVYSPKNTTVEGITRNLEKKNTQSSMFLIQANISTSDMQTIANRMFGKPNCQHITFLFFEPGTGKLFLFKKN